MDAKYSDAYIAELVKQLEELKRKRDRRLQTLKKLKKPSSKQDNLVENTSCHKAEDASQHIPANNERQDSSKCAKCRLCLISKDSPCIQCLSAEYKENKHQKNLESTIATLGAEFTNSENMFNSRPKLDRNNDSISVKEKQNYEILKVTLDNSGGTALEPSQNSRILVNLNEGLGNDCHQIPRKQKRRSTTLEDEPGQDEQCDHKKLKLSKEIIQEKNGTSASCSVNEDHFNAISSVVVPNEMEEKIVDTAEVVEDSLLHNMSCFLSSGLLGEEEDNSSAAKQSIMAESQMNHTKSELKSNANILPFPMKVNGSNNDEVKDSVKTGYCLAQVDQSTLDERKSEALFENGDCVQSINTSLPFNGGNVKVLDTFSEADSPQCIQNLENIQTKDFKNSQLNSTLCSDIGIQDDTKVSTPQLEQKNDFNEVCEDTFNCLSDVKSAKHEMKAYNDACENSQSNSQLIEDLKTSNFSSFENSNSAENVQLVGDVDAEKAEDNHTPSLLDSSDRMTAKNMSDDIRTDKPYCKNTLVKLENVKDNENPDLLHNINADCEDVEPEEEHSLNIVPETSALNCDRSLLEIEETENLFGDDALTADIDFEYTSLEVADTMDDLLTKSCKSGLAVSPDKPKELSPKSTSINVMELNEVFTIPETELLDAPPVDKTKLGFSKCEGEENTEHQYRVIENPSVAEDLVKVSSACNVFEETQCDTLDQLQTVQDSVFLDAEDSLELGKYKNIPFSAVKKTSSSEELHDAQETLMKYVCCLQSDIDEPVNDIKLVFFNNSSYVFIQHVTWIQVWRQEENRDWTKIFAHQVDDKLTLKEICFTKDASHLVLVMLLSSEQEHCLQFLLFESEVRVIKLMEHTHWLQNRCPEERVLLCGLGDLKFATAQGKETFDVFLHVFSSLQDNPRLMMATLGSTTGMLHSLCNIEKLPNALMGTSNNMLYVWHLLEARLVTYVTLQLPDLLSRIEKCIWATIENGLVFFMAVCEGKEGSRSSQLLATNLATGFCQIAMTYYFLPSTEIPRTSNLKIVYSEPFLAASCESGAFLWSATDEYCCAALETNVTSITIGNDSGDKFLVAVGNGTGCVNCYSIKCC